jgi:hypothetical protein
VVDAYSVKTQSLAPAKDFRQAVAYLLSNQLILAYACDQKASTFHIMVKPGHFYDQAKDATRTTEWISEVQPQEIPRTDLVVVPKKPLLETLLRVQELSSSIQGMLPSFKAAIEEMSGRKITVADILTVKAHYVALESKMKALQLVLKEMGPQDPLPLLCQQLENNLIEIQVLKEVAEECDKRFNTPTQGGKWGLEFIQESNTKIPILDFTSGAMIKPLPRRGFWITRRKPLL